jgi:GAF domain-containing protein
MTLSPPDDSGREQRRLGELHRYGILDTGAEAAFERIVELAQRVFNVPTVLISFVAEDRQWAKACRGFPGREVGA